MTIYNSIITRTPIQKGWSGDQKFKAFACDGSVYLLRISPMELHARRKKEFDQMKRIAELNIPMCLPIEFGTCSEGVYTIQSWIDGDDASDVISLLSIPDQYQYGLTAGRLLARIHTIPAPADVPHWDSHYNAKIKRKINMYNACGMKYEIDTPFLKYLADNRHLLEDRPQTLQHGDYHIGNMMLTHKGALMIIDFDRQDYGDPWQEFNRIYWCVQESPVFASGMVDGYFNGEIPLDFWKLLALYSCNNIIGSLPWAIPFGSKEIQTMHEQAMTLLEWYDGMERVIPSWYTSSI